MKTMKIPVLALFAVTLFVLIAGCTQPAGTPGPVSQTNVGILYSKGVGPMPMLLATKQIDGYIAWQPFVSIGTESGIARLVVYSGQLPPAGSNIDHPCCILFARNDLLEQNPDLVTAMSALTQASSTWINEHPAEAAEIEAEFLVGKGNFTYGNVTVSSVDVLNDAFPTVKYTNVPSPEWIAGTKNFVKTEIELGYITGELKNTSADQLNAKLFAFGPYEDAKKQLAAGTIKTPPKATKPITIGYLNGDMHSAALHISLKKWQYFNDTYGVTLKPRDMNQARPDVADLIVNGVPVAEIKLVGGDAGPQVMQMASTDIVQMGYVGVPPTVAAIDKGTPVKIIHPVNTEGSGLVVDVNAPVSDWKSFVAWATARSAEGKPLKIAAPGKGSIQDVMLQYALKDSNITYKETS
ncbi:MAG: ABC transporter substrate-binding protein [Methanoregula sp.]|nr:ABC transporter substrate-binding protein [Methanoregula sp.]